jgi:hypothetical protein
MKYISFAERQGIEKGRREGMVMGEIRAYQEILN